MRQCPSALVKRDPLLCWSGARSHCTSSSALPPSWIFGVRLSVASCLVCCESLEAKQPNLYVCILNVGTLKVCVNE